VAGGGGLAQRSLVRLRVIALRRSLSDTPAAAVEVFLSRWNASRYSSSVQPCQRRWPAPTRWNQSAEMALELVLLAVVGELAERREVGRAVREPAQLGGVQPNHPWLGWRHPRRLLPRRPAARESATATRSAFPTLGVRSREPSARQRGCRDPFGWVGRVDWCGAHVVE
jgi:hypothetical protein